MIDLTNIKELKAKMRDIFEKCTELEDLANKQNKGYVSPLGETDELLNSAVRVLGSDEKTRIGKELKEMTKGIFEKCTELEDLAGRLI